MSLQTDLECGQCVHSKNDIFNSFSYVKENGRMAVSNHLHSGFGTMIKEKVEHAGKENNLIITRKNL